MTVARVPHAWWMRESVVVVHVGQKVSLPLATRVVPAVRRGRDGRWRMVARMVARGAVLLVLAAAAFSIHNPPSVNWEGNVCRIDVDDREDGDRRRLRMVALEGG